MTNPDMIAAIAAGRKALDTARHRGLRDGRTGTINPSTGKLYADPCQGLPNRRRVWVRLEAINASDAGRGVVAAWVNGRVSTRTADIPVEIAQNRKGQWTVIGSDVEAADALGLPEGFYAADALPPELDPLAAKTFEFQPFHDPDLGGLYLYVAPGWYDGSWWPGGRILLVPTATASSKAAVVVGFDESTGALVQDLGADRSLAYAMGPLNLPGTAPDIATAWAEATFANSRPIAAVVLANGATTFANGDVIDIRDEVAVGGVGVSDADDVTYTPADVTDWTGGADPGDAADALDQLADRVDTLESATNVGGWTVDYDALIPASKDAFIPGTVTVTATLTVSGELYIV